MIRSLLKRMHNNPTFVARLYTIFAFSLSIILFSCANKADEPAPVSVKEKSDPKAVEIARAVAEASGGMENWEDTRYVTWRTFGKRLNVWDKKTNDVRIESRVSTILMNLDTRKGKAWKWSREITDPHELERAMDYGYEAWVYDTYWMLLPFKLMDDGVVLKYLGEGEKDSTDVHILQMTFDNVGLTPNNKFHLYIDKESKHIIRWDYYMDAEDEYPRFTNPWGNYKKYGDIMLSDDRGKKKHTDLAVFEELPATVFESPETVPWLAEKTQPANGTGADSH